MVRRDWGSMIVASDLKLCMFTFRIRKVTLCLFVEGGSDLSFLVLSWLR